MLRFEGVEKTFADGPGSVHALSGVDLEVDAGELVAVMGPSGSGKTTLIELAAGIDRPDRGRVVVDEQDLSLLKRPARARLRRRHIGVVHQHDDLDPLLTVVENVALPLRLDGTRQGPARAAAAAALEGCGVADLADRFPDQMSGGQRQRVAVSRAIVGQRALVLADEPTASVDSPTARALVELLVRVAGTGVAVVMTTHDSRLATFADRVILVRDGTLVGPDPSPTIPTGADR